MSVDLRLGDCLEVTPTFPAQSVDAIITDLPYGTTACKWDSIIPFAELWRIVKHVLKPRGAFVTTASQPFTSALIMSNVEYFSFEDIWDKKITTGFLDANRRLMRRHENVLVFCDGLPTYNPQKWISTPYKKSKRALTESYGSYICTEGINITGERFPTSIIEISNANRNKDGHPTQKPVALYEYLIKTYTNEGETVLDLTMGSGTTGVACVNTGRNFIGIEKEKEYFDIAERRIKQAQEARQLELV